MKIFGTIILPIISISIYSQTTIKGTILDTKNRPVPFANIYLKNSYDGTTSNENGEFIFNSGLKGEQVLVASCIGYSTKESKIYLNSPTVKTSIVLKVDYNQIERVVVTAGSFEASDEKRSVVLRPIDIVTTAGGAADIYETMKLLPGTQQVGETEGLFVRGGSASETVTIIDEMVVQTPFYGPVPDIPQRSRFQPFLFKGTMFSTGGYSALYGQALSSALILNSQDLADSNQTGFGINMAGANLFHAHRWKNTSLSIGGEYNNLKPYFRLIDQRTDWVRAPETKNGEFIFRHKFSRKDMFKVYVSGSLSDLEINHLSPTNQGITKSNFQHENKNLFINAGYKSFINNKTQLFLGTSYSSNTDNNEIDSAPLKTIETLFQNKLFLTRYLNNKNNLKIGGEYQYKSVETFGETPSAVYDYYAGFAELNQHITNRLATRVGLRSEHSSLNNDFNIAPRLSLAYKTGINSQLSVAYGHFFQLAEDSILLRENKLDNEKATHYLFNYQWNNNDKVFRIEAYYKAYENLVRSTGNFAAQYDNSGNGYAQGVDLFWRDERTIKNSDYWISYSFIDTKRLYRNLQSRLKPCFISDHTLSVVYKYNFPVINTTLGATYSWSSGRSFYRPTESGKYLTEVTPAYYNLSISASKIASVFGQFAVFYAAVYNVFNRKNKFAYSYSPNGEFRTTIGPTSLRSYFVGCFISIN